jgi:hypothetical protein
MSEDDDKIQTFPNITPSSVTSTLSHELKSSDIASETDFQGLIRQMFEFPERHYYYFQEKDGPRNELLLAKERAGLILFRETEFFYYMHPDPKGGYIRLDRSPDDAHEKQIVEKGPMFMRTTLGLPERTRRELEIRERLKLEEEFKRRRQEAEEDLDVFISYASADNNEAVQIRDAIVNAGGKAFMAPKDLTPGEDFAEEIRIALGRSRELWLLVSPVSLKSDWVLTEWGAAWALGKKIVPLLHRCSPEQLPDRIRRLHCVDFYKYSELIARTFSGMTDAVGSPRKWAFTQTFSPGESDKLNELDEFMAWPAHRDPKQGFAYPDPKSKKLWLVYCESYEADDFDPTLKKRHMVLVHINDPKVKRSKDTL